MSLHTNKKLFLQASLSILLSCSTLLHPQLSEQATLSTYQGAQGPWKYLEYIFVIKPQNELNHQTNHLLAIAGIGGAGVLTHELLKKTDTTSTPVHKAEQKSSALYNTAMLASAFFVYKTVQGYFTCYTQRNTRQKTLSNFLKNWDTHRSHIPTALVECFDELALAFQSQGEAILTADLVSEVFELIQHHIEHHFENRYKIAEKKNIDAIENFKNITETWKNLG